jgi:hypothetical protein
MLQPVNFEVYSLEDLCGELASSYEIGDEYFKYLCDEIICDDLDNCTAGMEYSLIYLKNIIQCLKSRSELDEERNFEKSLLNLLEEFMEDKDELTMIYVQGW